MSGPKAPMHPRPLSHESGHRAQVSFMSSKESMSHSVTDSSALSRTVLLSSSESFLRSAHPEQTSLARGTRAALSALLRLQRYTYSDSGSREFLSENESQSETALLASPTGTTTSFSRTASSPETSATWALAVTFLILLQRALSASS